MTTVFRESLG